MKKIVLALFSLAILFSFVSCDLGTSADPAATVETTTDDALDPLLVTSTWKIKGTFDSWTAHALSVDATNSNILLYKYTGLRALDYSFALVNEAGHDVWLSAAAVEVANTPFTMDKMDDVGEHFNPSFTALKTTYLVKVDITDPLLPVVTLIAGTTDATPYSEAEFAEGLKISGMFKTINGVATSNWTTTAGTYDSAAHTVSFVVTGSATDVNFYLPSLDGGLKNVTVASPTVLDGSVTAGAFATSGSDASITGIPNKDSVLTIVVAIDTAQATTAKYSMTVKLTAVGVAAGWTATEAEIAAALKIKGNEFTSIDGVAVAVWTEAAGIYVAGSHTVSWDVTITDVAGEFGFSSIDDFVKSAAVVAPASGVSAAAVELVKTGSSNSKITSAVNNTVYHIAVVLDATKAVGAGRYMMTVSRP